MPLIQEQVVTKNAWLTMSEFTDLISISEMTPGPIAVNSATFVGIRVAGIPGALAATAGCILPSCIVVTLIAKFYLKYRSMGLLQSILASIRPAVVAMIASAGIMIMVSALWGTGGIVFKDTHWDLLFIFAVCLLLLRKTCLSPILIMLSAGLMKLNFALCGQYLL